MPAGQTPAPPVPTQAGPTSHLTAAILVTILCCTIPGVIAIVYASSVSSRLAAGDIEGAEKASVRAEGWIIASFVLGMLSATLWFPVSLITNLL
ncbi:MAG: CD225/dispanin family protein [Prevotella sp.]|nr:CD225/dispanin family protein [Prevotella sp.]